jgi:hypothetical protein
MRFVLRVTWISSRSSNVRHQWRLPRLSMPRSQGPFICSRSRSQSPGTSATSTLGVGWNVEQFEPRTSAGCERDAGERARARERNEKERRSRSRAETRPRFLMALPRRETLGGDGGAGAEHGKRGLTCDRARRPDCCRGSSCYSPPRPEPTPISATASLPAGFLDARPRACGGESSGSTFLVFPGGSKHRCACGAEWLELG